MSFLDPEDEMWENFDMENCPPTPDEIFISNEINEDTEVLVLGDAVAGDLRILALISMEKDMDLWDELRDYVEEFHNLISMSPPGAGEYFTEHIHRSRDEGFPIKSRNWEYIKYPGCPGNMIFDTRDSKSCPTLGNPMKTMVFGPAREKAAIDGVLNKDNRTIVDATLYKKGPGYATFISRYGKCRVSKKFFNLRKFPTDMATSVKLIVALQDVERNIRFECIRFI